MKHPVLKVKIPQDKKLLQKCNESISRNMLHIFVLTALLKLMKVMVETIRMSI